MSFCFVGQRGIAFRGNYDKDTKEEDGNYIFFIKWIFEFDEKSFIAFPNSKYTSQNGIVALCGDYIRKRIVQFIPKY